MNDIPQMPIPVTLTEEATVMAQQAMDSAGLNNSMLRIGVLGGGCSGMQYNLDFSEVGSESELDMVYEQHGITVVVDGFSAAHMIGTTVEYRDTLQVSGFKFNNPNTQRSCGCGSSWQ